MLWTILAVAVSCFGALVMFRHVRELIDLLKDYQAYKPAEPLEKTVRAGLSFNEHVYSFSKEIHKFLLTVEDEFTAGALKIFFRNKDLGWPVLDQVEDLYNHHYEREMEKVERVKTIATALPLCGWAIVLTGVCFYFRNYGVNDVDVLGSVKIVGFAVLGACYGLALNLFILQPYAEKIKANVQLLKRKREIVLLTLKNTLHKKTRHELEHTLGQFHAPVTEERRAV